jgi:hypothetical protein
MKMSNPKTRMVVIISGLVVLAALVFVFAPFAEAHVVGPALGIYYRNFKAPPIVKSAFIEDLNEQQAAQQVEKLLSTYKAGKGSYGIHRKVVDTDGVLIGKWLVVEDGKATLVVDHTRDPASNRQFSTGNPQWLGPVPETDASKMPPGGTSSIRFYVVGYIDGRGVFF